MNINVCVFKRFPDRLINLFIESRYRAHKNTNIQKQLRNEIQYRTPLISQLKRIIATTARNNRKTVRKCRIIVAWNYSNTVGWHRFWNRLAVKKSRSGKNKSIFNVKCSEIKFSLKREIHQFHRTWMRELLLSLRQIQNIIVISTQQALQRATTMTYCN